MVEPQSLIIGGVPILMKGKSGGKKIFVLDDDRDGIIIDHILKAVYGCGHTLTFARTIQEAERRFSAYQPFDLICLSYWVGTDGTRTGLDFVKSMPIVPLGTTWNRTPIVLVHETDVKPAIEMIKVLITKNYCASHRPFGHLFLGYLENYARKYAVTH